VAGSTRRVARMVRSRIEHEIERIKQGLKRTRGNSQEKRIVRAMADSAAEILRLRKLVKEYEKVDALLDELVKIQARDDDDAANRFLVGAAKSVKSA
jgi:hypothetical protein